MTVVVCNRTSTMSVWFWKHICNINHWLAYLKLLYLLFHSKSQNIKQLLYACVRACTMKSYVVYDFWICFCQLSIRIFLISRYIRKQFDCIFKQKCKYSIVNFSMILLQCVKRILHNDRHTTLRIILLNNKSMLCKYGNIAMRVFVFVQGFSFLVNTKNIKRKQLINQFDRNKIKTTCYMAFYRV